MSYIIGALLASAGVALGVINVWQNAVAINGGAAEVNDLTAFVAALAVLSALASYVAGVARRRWPLAALVGVLIVIGCTITSVHYTLTRVGGQADGAAANALEHNAKLARAEERVAWLVSEVEAEAARGGCGRNCRALKGDLDAARAALDALGGPRVVDPAAERIEAATGGLWASNHYRVALPVIQAVTIEAGVAWLLFMSGQFFGLGLQRRRQPVVQVVEVDPIVRAIQEAGGRVESNRRLAALADMQAPRVSERVKLLQLEGVIKTSKQGRQVVYELA